MMTTLKISSNPYKKSISFASRKNDNESWNPIDQQNNPKSRLITNDISEAFFPYKVNDILNIIREEYYTPGEKIDILFEGTPDEYKELAEAGKNHKDIEIKRSDRMLENARDILPEIISIFSKIQPVVDGSIRSEDAKKELENDILKFTDASDDVIPICVLGNYSAGKSTFINALIGSEILPSGDMPVTAKIYRITQSHDNDSAEIRLQNNEKDIRVIIKSSGGTNDFEITAAEDDKLAVRIKEALENDEPGSVIAKKINTCLEIINDQKEGISDLIDIRMPFADGLLAGTEKSFVIFDTPGSNTATHRDHFSILEGAMKNLSNGIPIYVAEYSSLDSCDNKALYEKIKSISQIDSRFTMIVVNKADSANIKEETFDEDMEEMILSQAVPRNLYSGGIYFVSSIMGLGSKNNGRFLDDHADEFFEDNERKYSDPSSKRYKSLYKYNIMPRQIKQEIFDISENAGNRIFANSGLLAVEHELVNFAEKYSAYDKCKQSNMYIENIIDIAQEEIDETKESRESVRKKLSEELEKGKRKLIDDVEETCSRLSKEYKRDYEKNMEKCYRETEFTYSADEMKKLEKDMNRQNQEIRNLFHKVDEIKESGAAIMNEFAGLGKKHIADIAKNIGNNLKDAFEDAQEWNEIREEAYKATADQLIDSISDDFNKRVRSSIEKTDSTSRGYWEKNALSIKEKLIEIVTDSSSLDESKKKELSEIIISYGDIEFGEEHVFKKASFEKKLQLWGKVIDLNKLDIGKLAKTYNNDYSAAIDTAKNELNVIHFFNFKAWRSRLVDKIRTNIVDYNPKLSERSKQIMEETEIIESLENTRRILDDYDAQISSLMDWKTFE